MKRISTNLSAISAVALGFTATASAGPLFFSNLKHTPGDVVLTFQKIGSENTVYANIGNAATLFRGTAAGPDAANRIDILDLSTTLTTAFGADWATDVGIYAGAVTVQSTDSDTQDVISGDPARTLYVSKSRNTVGTVGAASSSSWNLRTAGDTAMSQASNNIFASNNTLETREEDSYTTIALTEDSLIDEQNPFLSGTIQGTAYGVLSGGVQQAGSASIFGTFGAAGSTEFALDLYRVLALEGLDGQVAGTGLARQSTYEGTITVGTNGKVSFIAQAAAQTSPYNSWMGTFPTITGTGDKLPSADPDNDGINNLMEFILNGNPSTNDNPSVAPTLNASGANFVFGFNRRDDSEAGNTLLFQYGSDLTGWTNVTIGAGNSVVGDATVTVTENTTNPDAITVTVPKPFGPSSKLFGRLKVTQP